MYFDVVTSTAAGNEATSNSMQVSPSISARVNTPSEFVAGASENKCCFVETQFENQAGMGYIMHWRWWLATVQDISPAILCSPQKLLDHYLTIRAFSSSKTTQNNGKNQKTKNHALLV